MDTGLPSSISPSEFAAFRGRVLARGHELYRDLPWRRTRNPYEIWISEVMLQQTQVARVDGRWQQWLRRYPTVDSLAQSTPAEVLEEWQGMGYNRRALALLRAAQLIVDMPDGFPSDVKELTALPGIGPATAAGVRAFAFNLPGVYLETNVRTVFLHELFSAELDVPDSAIAPLVDRACPQDADDPEDDPRSWYYALLDYGAHLKATVPNPSRRSRSYARQSRFEGSHRQKRAEVVRILLRHRGGAESGATLAEVTGELSQFDAEAGRVPLPEADVRMLLEELEREGLCRRVGCVWSC